MKRYLLFFLVAYAANALAGPKVYFIKPKDGEKLKGSEVEVVFGLKGMGIAPAGINADNTGHHHLLINYDGLPDLSKPLPAGEKLMHFGGGQTQATIKLKPGTHKLRLILGDYLHVPHKPAVMSEEITVHVAKAGS